MKKILPIKTNLIQTILLTFGLVGLLWTKPSDFGHFFLGLPRQGEFLGFVIRLSDVFLAIFWLFYIIFYQVKVRILKNQLFFWLGLISLMSYWIWINIETLYSFKTGFLTYPTLVYSVYLLYKFNSKWLWILLPYFIFDHVFLTSTLASTILLGFGVLAKFLSQKTTIPSNFSQIRIGVKILVVLIGLNLVLAIYQVFIGQDLGLNFLGESQLALTQISGVAKQYIPFTSIIVLRGYGLMPHPNVLGLLGVFGLVLAQSLKRYNFKYDVPRFDNLNIIKAVSLLIVFLSMSRMAWLSTIILVTISTFQKPNLSYIFKNFYIQLLTAVFLFIFIFIFSLNTRTNSDKYRLDQFQIYIEYIKQNPYAIIFGVGPSQYPHHLKRGLSYLPNWQIEPFNNPIGLIVVETGFVGVGWIVVYGFRLHNRLCKVVSTRKTYSGI